MFDVVLKEWLITTFWFSAILNVLWIRKTGLENPMHTYMQFKNAVTLNVMITPFSPKFAFFW